MCVIVFSVLLFIFVIDFYFILHEVFSTVWDWSYCSNTCFRVFKEGRKEAGWQRFLGPCSPPHASVDVLFLQEQPSLK